MRCSETRVLKRILPSAGLNAACARPCANVLTPRVGHGILPVGAQRVAKVTAHVLRTPARVCLEAGQRRAHAWPRLHQSAHSRDVQLSVGHQCGVDERDVLSRVHAHRRKLRQTAKTLPEAPLLGGVALVVDTRTAELPVIAASTDFGMATSHMDPAAAENDERDLSFDERDEPELDLDVHDQPDVDQREEE
jgi:hypothetical protein